MLMSISQLKDKIEHYDRYGVHRINGLKALYIVELLLLFELFSSMVHPYFYYFFAPLTCFTAEMTGNTLEEKYWGLFWCLIALTIAIFFFGVFSIYKTFFIFFVFFFSSGFYYLVLRYDANLLVIVPLVLGVASYSLTYLKTNSNFYIALNHGLYTSTAMAIIFAGLFLFPKTYYLSIWKRALLEVIHQLKFFCTKWLEGQAQSIPIVAGMVIMERYTHMMPKKNGYTVMKITGLMFELIMLTSYLLTFEKNLPLASIQILHDYLNKLYESCKLNKPLILRQSEIKTLQASRELVVLYKVIMSWNYLCVR